MCKKRKDATIENKQLYKVQCTREFLNEHYFVSRQTMIKYC